MSQVEPTDLLCRSRREELTADEQRRLNESIQRSLEVKLLSQMLPEFERESRVRPGDDLLLARISARALGVPEKASRKRPALTMLLVAAAVLLVASIAGAWFGIARVPNAPSPWPARVIAWPWGKAAKPAKPGPPRSAPTAKVVPSATPSALPVAPKTVDDSEQALPILTPSAPASGSVFRRAREHSEAPHDSASELFARANLRRRQGRAGEAAVLYELLLDLYPNSREVGPTRLALAKYLQGKQPERSLAQYRAVASGGGPLRAEALWGISEVATTLGEHSVAERSLADLLREFPDSPYAEVARSRTSHGLP